MTLVDEILVGQSSAFKSMQSQLEKVSSSNARVMLSGEAGSGKEAAARVIHNTSVRKSLPFTIVNCSNSDSESFDETLFGSGKRWQSCAARLIRES